MKIGVLGHYGTQNLGDEAIVAAAIQNIRAILPGAQICGFSINPEDTEARHGIKAFAVRRPASRCGVAKAGAEAIGTRNHAFESAKNALKRVASLYRLAKWGERLVRLIPEIREEAEFLRYAYSKLKGLDLMLVAGSNQLEDMWGGAWGYPYTLLKWSLLAKLAGAKVVFASVGAGPLDAWLSRLLIRLCVWSSDYLSLRDVGSKKLIASLCPGAKVSVYPDLAHGLLHEDSAAGKPVIEGCNKPTVGINLMPVYDGRYFPYEDAEKYGAYIRCLARFSSALIRNGYPVFFFSTQTSDRFPINDILSVLREDRSLSLSESALVRLSSSIEELMATLEQADLVVATRLHAVLLSLRAGKPVLGICYQQKTADLMTDMGQSEYSMAFDDLREGELVRRFKALEANAAEERKTIRRIGVDYRCALAEQYKMVLSCSAPRIPEYVGGRFADTPWTGGNN